MPDSNASRDDARDLTAGVAAGDPAALERFYRRWFDHCFATARHYTGRDESFCLDVVHDVMLKAIHAIPTLDSREQLAAWIRRAALTTALDRLRAERRRGRRDRHHHRFSQADRPPSTIDTDLEDRLELIHRALATLPIPDADLLTARFRFGWTLHQTARAAGLSAGAADSKLRRILSALARLTGDSSGPEAPQ